MNRKIFHILFIALMLCFNVIDLYANEDEHIQHVDNENHTEFKAGEMILDHVVDHHNWHIIDIGEKSIVIELPIILYDEGEWHFFMSSKFHHGHESYKGFMIAQEGDNKGKIVKTIPGTMHEDKSASLPIDLSITKTVFAIFISALLLCIIFISVAKRYQKNTLKAPKGLQSFLEPLILFIVNDVARDIIGERDYRKFVPYLLTVFFFIFLNNLLGLMPISANVTGNIGVTLVLAMFTFIITNVRGTKGYWQDIFNTPGVPWFLKYPIPLMPLVEILGMITKPFALMMRLFANITGGHIVLLSFVSLIFILGIPNPTIGYVVSPFSVLLGLFMSLLELLVAFIQAYIFTLLSATFFSMSQVHEHETH